MRLNLPSSGLGRKINLILDWQGSLGAPGSKTELHQVPPKPGSAREQRLGSLPSQGRPPYCTHMVPHTDTLCLLPIPHLSLYSEELPCPPPNILSFQPLCSHVQLETPYGEVMLLAYVPKGTCPHTLHLVLNLTSWRKSDFSEHNGAVRSQRPFSRCNQYLLDKAESWFMVCCLL